MCGVAPWLLSLDRSRRARAVDVTRAIAIAATANTAIAASAIASANAIVNASGGRWWSRSQSLCLLAQCAKHCLWNLIPEARAEAVLTHPQLLRVIVRGKGAGTSSRSGGRGRGGRARNGAGASRRERMHE